MQTDTAGKILAIVKILSVEQQEEVLNFIDKLQTEETSLKSVFRKIEERGKSIPDEICKEMPEDGSEQHDHYIYGSPKRKKV